MAVEKNYAFDGPKGKASLLDLFDGRRQLIVYRAFFEPGVHGWPEHACIGCSLGADQVAHLAHLNARDTTLVYASRAPQADIARLKARMGWEMPWFTITDSFDADFGVDEWHGHNAFIRDGDRIFRTYFINSRGDEAMGNVWSYLDMTALGRQEEWEDSPEGYSADPALQMVELARQLRPRRRARPEVGRNLRRRRGRDEEERLALFSRAPWSASPGDALSAPLPPRALARGGEGSGVGGGAAFTEQSVRASDVAVPADRPPTPDPSPPLRGGRGEIARARCGSEKNERSSCWHS